MALFMALRKGPLQMTAVVLFRPQKSVVRRALALGIPVFLERACFSCGQLIVTHMVAGLGNIALAANHVAVTAEAISYLPAQGVSFAATAAVGQAIGGNQPVLARDMECSPDELGCAPDSWPGYSCFSAQSLWPDSSPLIQR